jgi:cobalt-precorrin-5B (C1)-methyltransferase
LRHGYTTGACAAAAAKGALLSLLQQQAVAEVSLVLPMGQVVAFPLHRCEFSRDEAFASVIKDAGDDPDVTHHAEIGARIRWSSHTGVAIRGGKGVGIVTKKGLPVQPGEPAINPAPRKLIIDTLAQVLAEAHAPQPGVVVEVVVPRGEELAKKTFNPRLGIVGGISILGTTGIVVPYSTSAWVASVVQAIDVAAAQGIGHVVLSVGARGERLARQYFDLPEMAFIQTGPFIGEALAQCGKDGIVHISLTAMIGKLAKFAAGHSSVHSTSGPQDFKFLAGIATEVGADANMVEQVLGANTAQEVAEMMSEHGLTEFFIRLCRRAAEFARTRTSSALVDVLLLAHDGRLLARCSG